MAIHEVHESTGLSSWGIRKSLTVEHPASRDSASPEDFVATHSVFRRGDIVGIRGFPARSQSAQAELSIVPRTMQLLAPNLHQLPTQHFGFKDQEQRYRKRYLDLIMNGEVRDVFIKRAKIIDYVRRFLDGLGFLEVGGTRSRRESH